MTNCNEKPTPATEYDPAGPLRLFIVGESSGNPADWNEDGPRAVVLARSPAEARSMSGCAGAVVEVRTDKPTVLLTTVGMHFNV